MLDFDLEKPPAEIVALGDVGGVTSPPPHWLERGVPSRQSSLIVEPANGRMPAMTAEGKARQKGSGGTYVEADRLEQAPASWAPYDRCISRGVVGSMMPVVYNNGNQIIQTPGYVVFRNEMIHETRIIPLDGRPDAAGAGQVLHGRIARPLRRQHAGGANHQPERPYRHAGQRHDADAERRPGTGRALHADQRRRAAVRSDGPRSRRPGLRRGRSAFPLKRESDYQFFEYACHEGNNAMRNILSGSRADERAAAAGK